MGILHISSENLDGGAERECISELCVLHGFSIPPAGSKPDAVPLEHGLCLHAVKSLVYRTTSSTSPESLQWPEWGSEEAVKQPHYSAAQMHLRYQLIAVAIVAIVDVTVMTVSSVPMKLGFTTLMRHEDPSEPLGIWCLWKLRWIMSWFCTSDISTK